VPTILSVTGTVNSFTLSWSPVVGAYSYTVQYSQDPTFATGSQTGIVNAPGTTYTVSGREPNTIYYVRVKSYPNLPGDDTASDYSAAQSVRTLASSNGGTPGGDGNTSTSLQGWLTEEKVLFHSISLLVPELVDTQLMSGDRMRLNGSGVRRWGFIEKVLQVSLEYPQFWPNAERDSEALNEYVREITALRNLLIWFRKASRIVGDLLLIAGDDAFRLSGTYYAAARDRARRRDQDAMQVFDMLRLLWKRPRKNSGEQPTKKQEAKDAIALMHGTKVGEMDIINEADTVTRGRHVVIDNVRPKPRGGVKETLTEEVE
jgi:hypothetical protein